MILSATTRYLSRFVALGYVLMLVAVPVGLILLRTFEPGFGAFVASISTPAAISALHLSLLVVAIVVPLNVIFGVPTALLLARKRFRGKGVLQAVIDLPFAVSPVIVGVALNWFGDSLDGSLARYRREERPRFGFLVDHTCDLFSQILIIVAFGLSPFLSLVSALDGSVVAPPSRWAA